MRYHAGMRQAFARAIALLALTVWLPAQAADTTRALDLRTLSSIDAIVPALAAKRVVYIGEQHDRYDHHLNQLELLKRLHARHPDLALGLEFFQQPFQPHLDAYIAGAIDTHALLKRTEYYRRWKFDFRLYAPILAYAREHRIPVIALNVPSEVTAKLGRVGLEGLTPEERAALPKDVDRSNKVYRERLRTVFREHPGNEQRDFDRFVEAQLAWDEGMAERAADYLKRHPTRRLVVLAGNGHLAYRAGIPQRLERRIAGDGMVVLQGGGLDLAPGVADFVLISDPSALPPAGTLGVLLEPSEGVQIAGLAPDSAAMAAGLQRNDEIRAVDRQPVKSVDEVKALLWDKKPGERVTLTISRGLFNPTEQQIEVELRDHQKSGDE